MYWGISQKILKCVPGTAGLISACEMLEAAEPSIAGALGVFARSIFQFESEGSERKEELQQAIEQINRHLGNLPLASPKELRKFADAMNVGADGSEYEHQLLHLSYLCYSALSIFGEIEDRFYARMNRVQYRLDPEGTGVPTYDDVNDIPAMNEEPVIPEYPDVQAPVNSPTKNYPQIQPIQPIQSATEESPAEELINTAIDAINGGSEDIAYAALVGAIDELKKRN